VKNGTIQLDAIERKVEILHSFTLVDIRATISSKSATKNDQALYFYLKASIGLVEEIMKQFTQTCDFISNESDFDRGKTNEKNAPILCVILETNR